MTDLWVLRARRALTVPDCSAHGTDGLAPKANNEEPEIDGEKLLRDVSS